MRQTPLPLSARRSSTLASALTAPRQCHGVCSSIHDERCFHNERKAISFGQLAKPVTTVNPPPRLLHMDECDDPRCPDAEQLNEWQKSLDHFTDYEHYERCCDEGGHHHHHCSHGLVLEKGKCCESSPQAASLGVKDVGRLPDCKDCFNDCDDCTEDHSDCYEDVDVCEEDCEQCEEECEERGHDREDCPQDHPTTRDNCLDNCNIPLPLLGPTGDFDFNSFPNGMPQFTPCTDDCNTAEAPVPRATEDSVFDTALDHWHTFAQAHHCAPDPCLTGQVSQMMPLQHVDAGFGFSFGCDPTIPSNQYPWQRQWQNQYPPQHQLPYQIQVQHQLQQEQPQSVYCAIPASPARGTPTSSLPVVDDVQMLPADTSLSTPSVSSRTSVAALTPTTSSEPSPERLCQWVMPCGSICGAAFDRTEDLKKHVKNSHGVKGTVSCGWKGCSASFASEAALTGHISKKHLAFDEEGPWKCTIPNCTKSFMYKQVRDEHVASHNGGNRMHCPICHQWLNAEGSNFRRHMASHNPKNEHMKCKYEQLGCKKRFPRVDNLRRHETCCKFGKRALGVHHHHHHHPLHVHH